MSNSEVIKLAHDATAIPSILILYFSTFLILFLVGMFVVKKSRAKFYLIFVTTLIFSTVVLMFTIFSPNSVQAVADFFRNLF